MVVLERSSKIMDFQPPQSVGRIANHQIRLPRAPSVMLFPERMKRKILKISEVCCFWLWCGEMLEQTSGSTSPFCIWMDSCCGQYFFDRTHSRQYVGSIRDRKKTLFQLPWLTFGLAKAKKKLSGHCRKRTRTAILCRFQGSNKLNNTAIYQTKRCSAKDGRVLIIICNPFVLSSNSRAVFIQTWKRKQITKGKHIGRNVTSRDPSMLLLLLIIFLYATTMSHWADGLLVWPSVAVPMLTGTAGCEEIMWGDTVWTANRT